jgi:hypothetical protein
MPEKAEKDSEVTATNWETGGPTNPPSSDQIGQTFVRIPHPHASPRLSESAQLLFSLSQLPIQPSQTSFLQIIKSVGISAHN